MIKIKTSELTGSALDWAVAKIEHPDLLWGSGIGIHHASHQIVIPHLPEPQCYWSPSTNWAQGGPIIGSERISVGDQTHIEGQPKNSSWYATNRKGACGFGVTPLIACMRCYAVSKLGDTLDLPDGLDHEDAPL